jgi:hypothetical protein
MHRIIMSAGKKEKVDHIDHNGLNNTKENMRLITTKDNAKHRETRNKNNTSGYRNVCWINGYWRIQLQVNGVNTRFPEKFSNVDEAGLFAEKKRNEIYGEFAGNN